jgi:DNA-binding response OmpR family regulator
MTQLQGGTPGHTHRPRLNRVLVVDDSEDAAWALASLLQSYGHEVHVAQSGRRAIDLAERFRPEVIFLDLAMQEMDGFETALRIRRRRWGEGIVLCALTAFDSQEFRERSDEVGINRYLPKPAECHEVLAVAAASRGRVSQGRAQGGGRPNRTAPDANHPKGYSSCARYCE